jgi:hypothetical protein
MRSATSRIIRRYFTRPCAVEGHAPVWVPSLGYYLCATCGDQVVFLK